MKYLCLVFLFVVIPISAFAQQLTRPDRMDILEILESYSDRTGVKFVTDPRVKARVKMIGIKLDELDQTDINKILLIHSFVAYEKGDIVYVIPMAVEKEFGKQIGTKWKAN